MTYLRRAPPPPPHSAVSPPKTGSTRLQKQAITRTPSSLFISHFSFPSPCENMHGLGWGRVEKAEAAAGCSKGAQMEGLPWCEMNEKGQTQRRPAGAESTERNLLCRLSAGCKLRPRFCVAISGEGGRLWQVSNDAKHIISGILSRIRKGSLSIVKDMIVGILTLFLRGHYEQHRFDEEAWLRDWPLQGPACGPQEKQTGPQTML